MAVAVPVITPPRSTETASIKTNLRNQFPPKRLPSADRTFEPFAMMSIGRSAHESRENKVLRTAETTITFRSRAEYFGGRIISI